LVYHVKSFDYIVVGAGSAGSVLAWEMARRELGTVAVLESGTRATHRNSRIPILYPWLFRESPLCHPIETVPQSELAHRRIPLPAGKGLGGSSLVNAMIWSPPSLRNLSDWESITGGHWKIAEQQDALKRVALSYFPEPDTLPMVPFVHSSLEPFLHARDCDGEAMFFPYRRTLRSGRRLNAWQANKLPSPVSHLQVLRGLHTNRILFNDQTAIGVEITDPVSGTKQSLLANRGVILCAGALHSPEVLLRSGLGRCEELAAAGIEPRIESPQVGRNLQDHLIFPVIYRSNLQTLPSRFGREDIQDWLSAKNQLMTSNIAELGSFLSSTQSGDWKLTTGNSNTCDLATMPLDGQLHLTPTHYLEYPIREQPTQAMSIGITPLHPQSRGTVRMNPSGQIEIDPNYLAEPEDREVFIKMIQWIRNHPMHRLCELSIGDEILPGTKRQRDEQVAASLSRFATTLYHYIGTCSVGTDPLAVCDPDFQVRGVSQLYVCDGSILPSQPCGNTQVSVMMIAHLLANRLSATK
jgi:choline dehydrogenase